jgi:divalent metal cation (Fe/Co/Zn/Cd) transporter
VREGHEIAHLVKDRLLHSDFRILDALVHVEPSPDPRPDPNLPPDPGPALL